MNEFANDSEVLQRIDRTVTEMRVSLFGMDGTNGFVGTTKLRLDAHTKRVGIIEKWMWSLTGAGAVLASLIGRQFFAHLWK